jgi:hypothetical protein
MRVFYTEEPNIITRRYFITVENVALPERLKSTKAFEAETTAELKTKIAAYYGFSLPSTMELQLWAGPHGSSNNLRVDLDTIIPESHDSIWVKVANTTNNITTN